MEGQSRRGYPELLGDGARGQSLGSCLDEEPEHLEAGLLRQGGKGKDGFLLFHISTTIERLSRRQPGIPAPDLSWQHCRMTRRAAAVVIHRPVRGGSAAPGELDVYLVLRSPELAFLGNTMAFPGGVLERGDEALPLAGLDSDCGKERAVVACAARELLEETSTLARRAGRTDRGRADFRGSINGPEALRQAASGAGSPNRWAGVVP